MNNNIKNTIVCDTCAHEFTSAFVHINQATIRSIPDMECQYYTCPNCGKVYVVLLIDGKYRKLARELDEVKVRQRRAVQLPNNVEVVSRLSELCSRKLKKLIDHQQNLRRNYPGTFTVVSSEGNGELFYHEA